MDIRFTENFISVMLEEFNRDYLKYKDKLKIIKNSDTELTLTFYNTNYALTVSDLQYDYGFKDISDSSLMWINISDLFNHIVNNFEKGEKYNGTN